MMAGVDDPMIVSDQFFTGVFVNLAECVVDADDLAGVVGHRHHRVVVERDVQRLGLAKGGLDDQLRVGQRRLRLLAVGDVQVGDDGEMLGPAPKPADRADEPAAFVRRVAGVLERSRLAVAGQHRPDRRCRRCRLEEDGARRGRRPPDNPRPSIASWPIAPLAAANSRHCLFTDTIRPSPASTTVCASSESIALRRNCSALRASSSACVRSRRLFSTMRRVAFVRLITAAARRSATTKCQKISGPAKIDSTDTCSTTVASVLAPRRDQRQRAHHHRHHHGRRRDHPEKQPDDLDLSSHHSLAEIRHVGRTESDRAFLQFPGGVFSFGSAGTLP